MPQLARITFQSPSFRYLKCPYQAKVMKILEIVSNTIVRIRICRSSWIGELNKHWDGKHSLKWQFRQMLTGLLTRIRNQSNVQGETNKVRPRRRRERRQLRAVHRAIERIALDGDAPSRANQAFQFIARRELGSFRSRVVINLFFHDRAIQIVRAKAQRNLRDARREHDPVRLDVFEIVEQQA